MIGTNFEHLSKIQKRLCLKRIALVLEFWCLVTGSHKNTRCKTLVAMNKLSSIHLFSSHKHPTFITGAMFDYFNITNSPFFPLAIGESIQLRTAAKYLLKITANRIKIKE